MQTAVINFTTEERTKQEAQKVAKQLGISLSMVLNNYLKLFVKTKTVVFTQDKEIPNAYLQDVLKKADKDIKKGRISPGFDNAKDAIDWLSEK